MKIHDTIVTMNEFHIFTDFKVDSWQFFEIGRQRIFLLKGKDLVKIFSYNKGEIFPLQDIQVNGLEKVVSVQISNFDNEALLIFIFDDRMEFYSQDKIKFLCIMIQKFENKYMLETTTPVLFQDIPYLLIESRFGSDLFQLSVLPETEGKNSQVRNALIDKLRDIKSRYEHQSKILKKIEDEISFIPTVKEVVEKKLVGESSEDSVTSLRNSWVTLDKNLKAIKQSLDKLKTSLKDVVPKSGTKKIITGVKHFYGPKTAIDELVVTFANTGDILTDKEPLAKIIQNLVQIDDERPIEGRKIFGGDIRAENLHTSTLNGHDMKNYITSNNPAEIDGAVYLTGVYVQNDVSVLPGSEVYGRDLSEDVVTQRGYHELGNCHFENLKLLDGVKIETDIVNFESFKELTSSFLKSEGNISFHGSVAFSDLIIKGNLDAHSVMGINKTLLLSELVPKYENKTLTDVKFSNSVRCEDLEAYRVNGESFPEEFVVNSGSWINFGSKTFKKINFKELSVGGYIDNIKTSDLITKSTPQNILGLKTFEKGIKVFGNLNIVASRIDGVDISLLASNLNQKVDKNVVIFEEEVTAPGVIVKGKVNNLIIEDVANDLVYKGDYETIITGRKVFLEDLVIEKSLISSSINKIDFSTFVNTEKRCKFSAEKTFSSMVNFYNIEIKGLIDNTNLTELVRASVLLDKPYQIVAGEKHFESLSVNHLDIVHHMNHQPIINLLTKTTSQVFSGNIILDKATFENISTKEVHLYKNGTINGLSWLDIKRDLERAGNLDAELIVEGDVIVKKELRVNTLNQHRTNDLYNLLLKNERLQVLDTDVHFKDLEINGMVSTTEHATGNATLLKKNAASAFKTLEKNYVKGNMWWETIEASEVNVRGLINGIKVHKLHQELIYLNDPNTYSIKGPKHFLNGFKVFGDIETNSVNGKDLRKNLFSKMTRQVIRYPAAFGHIIAQNILLKIFNGIDLNLFRYTKKKEKTLIVAPISFNGYVHVSHLKLNGKVGDEDVASVLDDAVDLRSRKVIITGKKTFLQPPTFTSVTVVALNSEHLQKRDKEADSTFNFLVVNGTISVQKLKADNLKTKNGSSLLSPSYLRNNYVLAKNGVLETLKFEDLVIEGNVVANRINDGNLEEKFLTRSTDQIVWHPMNISTMFTKDVYVHGVINGYRVPNDTMTQERTKVITGSVVHNGTIRIPGSLFVKGKFGINDIDIPDDLIFLNQNNKINGLVSFTAPLVTTYIESMDRTLNEMELSTLDSSLRSYRKIFKETIISKSNDSGSYIGAMKAMYERECQRTSELQSHLTRAIIQPHSFEIVSVQEFDSPKNFTFVPQPESGNIPILIYKSASNHWMINSLHFGSCETKILKWNKLQLRFEEVYSLGNVGNVRQWIKLDWPHHNMVFLLAVTSDNGNCGLKGSSLWEADHSSPSFEKVQEFEAASKTFVLPGSPPYVYFDVGYKLTLWSFLEGILEKLALPDENQEPILKILKSFDKPDGGRITVQYYEDMLDIMDDTRRRILFMPNIKYITITTQLDDVVFIISKTQSGLRGTQFSVEVHLYKDLNLMLITSEKFNEPSLILPLDIPGDDSDSKMIFALAANSPRVYTLGGEPFVKIWAEFPAKLNENLWAFQFIDSENKFYLSFGDDRKIYTVRLKKEGKKYHGSILNCH